MKYKMKRINDDKGNGVKTKKPSTGQETGKEGKPLYKCKFTSVETGSTHYLFVSIEAIERIRSNGVLGGDNAAFFVKVEGKRITNGRNTYEEFGLKDSFNNDYNGCEVIFLAVPNTYEFNKVYYMGEYIKDGTPKQSQFRQALLNFKTDYKDESKHGVLISYLNDCFDMVQDDLLQAMTDKKLSETSIDVISFPGNGEEDRFGDVIMKSHFKEFFRKKILSGSPEKKHFHESPDTRLDDSYNGAIIDNTKLLSRNLVIIDDIYTLGHAHMGVLKKIREHSTYDNVYIIVIGHTGSKKVENVCTFDKFSKYIDEFISSGNKHRLSCNVPIY